MRDCMFRNVFFLSEDLYCWNDPHIYIYIYIVHHRQTISLYHNASVWLNTQDAWSWDWNFADFYTSRRFYHTATRKLSISEGILTHMYYFCFVYIYIYIDIYKHTYIYIHVCVILYIFYPRCWWLVGLVVWHINLCRLFNAKSIFMRIVLFQTIQFSMSIHFNGKKTFLFQAIQFI